ncbi:MAG: flagellar hook protein [Eubacterium sp.]|nr:flagellar hook protein [Eubacterium sp.]
MVVQHNLTAMNSNRMLGITTSSQAKSSEKLSSGYKINRAADDAAGLTISEKMRKQMRGLDQASTNAQDGVSAVQTAEGALTEVHSMLQRMNELANQAANGSNSQSDRDAIQAEIDQLTTEIDRVAETTKFNETYLLKGDAGTKTINLQAHDAGLKGTLTDNGDGTATFVMDALEAGDTVSIGGKNYTIGGTADDVEEMLNDADIATKHQDVTVNGTVYKYNAGQTGSDGDPKKDTINAGWYKDTPVDSGTGAATEVDPDYEDVDAFKAATGTISVGTKSVTVMTDADSDGVDDNSATVISKEKAYELAAKELLKANQIGDTVGSAKVGVGDVDTAVTDANGTGTFEIQTGQAKVANTLSFNLHVGADADMTNKIQVDIETMNSAYLGVKGLNVSDDSGIAATYAIDAISDAISKVSSQRSALGAVQNRLEHTIANLDNVVENTTAAESRIRDTDMAEEMVEYSKNNILAQAGQSMLAQANQSNQGVLSLLG